MTVEKTSFEIMNSLSELDRLHENLAKTCTPWGMTKKDIFQINLVLDEVCTNIISYGFRDKNEHWIKLTLWHQNGTINLRIVDDGVPFNPLETEDPDLECPLEEREVGGLGCHFMKCYMDHVHYKRKDNKNILTLKKVLEQVVEQA